MKMTFASKDKLSHIVRMKSEDESMKDWEVKERKAYAIVAQCIKKVSIHDSSRENR